MRAMLTMVGVLLSAAWSHAGDVPQFRGPDGLGVSPEKGLPVNWSEKENIRWKAVLPGRGLSNPVIAAGRVYVTGSSGFLQSRLHVLCFDLKSGKQLWDRQFWATGGTQCHPKTNMAAPTPITDGARVYALFATGDLVCLDKEGDLVWYRSLVGDYPTIGNNVGMAASPALWKGLLFVPMENTGESFVAAIDKDTGTNVWRVDRPRGINWTTPLVIQNAGEPEVLIQSSDGLTAYDASSGKKKWNMAGAGGSIVSPSYGNGLVLASAGTFLAIKPGGDDAKAEVAWKSSKLPTGYASPVYYDGRVVTVSTKGIVNCADGKSGKALWDLRLEGEYAGSPLAADGKVYVVSEEGVTTVLEAGVEAKVLATNQLTGKFLASPVAADGAIFLRAEQTLYCIGR